MLKIAVVEDQQEVRDELCRFIRQYAAENSLQVEVLPISEKYNDYAEKVAAELTAAGVRVEKNFRPDKIGYKIREAQLQKIPYMLIVGEKEAESGTISVRSRRDGDAGACRLSEFVETIQKEIKDKAR